MPCSTDVTAQRSRKRLVPNTESALHWLSVSDVMRSKSSAGKIRRSCVSQQLWRKQCSAACMSSSQHTVVSSPNCTQPQHSSTLSLCLSHCRQLMCAVGAPNLRTPGNLVAFAHLLVLSGMRCGSLPSVSRCPRPGFRRSSPGASGQPRNRLASGASAPCCDQSLCRKHRHV